MYTQHNTNYHLLRASIQQTLCSCVNFLCWINTFLSVLKPLVILGGVLPQIISGQKTKNCPGGCFLCPGITIDLNWNPDLASYCVTLDKMFNLTESQFPRLSNGNNKNNNAYFIESFLKIDQGNRHVLVNVRYYYRYYY